MKTMLKQLLCIVVCAALIFGTLTTAFADGTLEPSVGDETTTIDARTGGEASTNFMVLTYSDFSILSATEDFVMAVGASETLMVNVKGLAPVTYDWQVSADGGTSFSPAPGATNASTYQITNAQENTPAQQPYIYRVTVDDASSAAAVSRDITVLVSDDYQYKKIELGDGNVGVAGYIHADARLVIAPLSDADLAAIALEAELSPGCLPLIICDVTLVSGSAQVVPYFGSLQLEFDVGAAYNGQTLKVFHLHNGNILTYTGVVADGILSITVTELSPFMVEVPIASTHTVTASAGAGGSISPSGTVNVANGSEKTFTFLPDANYAIDTVTVNGTSVTLTGNSYTIRNITADTTIAVSFREVAPTSEFHTVTAACGENGSIRPHGSVQVQHGSAQTFYFYPDANYELDQVTVDGIPVSVLGSSFTISAVESDTAVHATFRPGTAQLPNVRKTVSASAGDGGSISPPGDIEIEYGGGMYFYFIPDAGYAVDKLLVDGVETAVTGNSYQLVNVTADRTIHVTFKQNAAPPPAAQTYHTITASAGANGSISPSGSVQIAQGGSLAFYFMPKAGFKVDTVTVDGEEVNASGNAYSFSNITANHTIRVTFVKTAAPSDPVTYHTITASAGANGTISPAGEILIPNGDGQTFSFIPDAGYAVDTVMVDGKTAEVKHGAYRFENVSADHTVHVTFKKAADASVPTVYHTVIVSAEGNGSISPSGNIQVPYGGSQTFHLIADDGYEVESIYVNGKKQDVVGSQFTVDNITGDIELSVTFKPMSVPASSGAAHCFICGWFGGNITPWCWLAPVIFVAVLGGVLCFCLYRRRK